MAEAGGKSNNTLDGRVAVVTGGGSGIGRAVCLAAGSEGASIVAVDVNERRIQETMEELQRRCGDAPSLGLALDVREEQAMDRMARQTLARFGRIDILVHCAGILRPRDTSPKPMVELSVAEWDATLDTNLKGTFLSNRAVLPTMIEQRCGHIINVSSTSGRQGRALDSAYCASKFGVIGFSEAVAEEVRPYGVKLETILPDATDTPLWDQNGPVPRPADALPAVRVADFIVYLLKMPKDTILLNPVIASFRTRRRVVGQRKSGMA
jgi:NAD(P)-dependent dehydrogenase (short-subunit alcohol dehydrogenase family)